MTTITPDQIHNEVTTGEPLEKGGYFVAYNLVMRKSIKVFDLSSGEFNCLTMLLSYAGADKDKCFPGYDTLAEDLNTNSRTVKRYIASLEKKGVLVIYNRFNEDGSQNTNVYDLSPCLNKIRDMFCQSTKNDGMKLVRKSSKHRDDKIDTPINKGMTELSPPGCQDCHPTSNNIQITNTNNLEEEEKANSHSPVSLTQSEIDTIVSELRSVFSSDLREHSFAAVVKLAKARLTAGKVHTDFREYLLACIVRKIDELEDRRQKDADCKQSEPKQPRSSSSKRKPTRTELLPDWLEEQKQQQLEQQQAPEQQPRSSYTDKSLDELQSLLSVFGSLAEKGNQSALEQIEKIKAAIVAKKD